MEGIVGDSSIERSKYAFIVVSPSARTDSSYPLKGYAGHSGRIDVIAMSMIASSQLEDSIFAGVLLGPPKPPLVLLVDSRCKLPKSERGVVSWIRLSVSRGRYKCIHSIKLDLVDLASILVGGGFRLALLSENGVDVSRALWIREGKTAFLLGSHVDIPYILLERLASLAKIPKISVGPKSLHTSHVILLLSWLLAT